MGQKKSVQRGSASTVKKQKINALASGSGQKGEGLGQVWVRKKTTSAPIKSLKNKRIEPESEEKEPILGQKWVTKSPKGSVSISHYEGRIRLRWRYEGRRFSLNLLQWNDRNLYAAKMAALNIEHDMMVDAFDETLERYHTIAKSAVKTRRAAKKTVANGSTGRTERTTPKKVEGKKASRKSEPEPFILAHDFERWARSYRQIDCTENMHYYGVRSMLRRWGLTPPLRSQGKNGIYPIFGYGQFQIG